MQTVKNAAASAKETAANVAASAKSGVDKSKAVAQEKVEKMKAQDPMEKHIATVKKLDKIQLAEVNKQEALNHNAAVKRASISTAPTQPPSTTCVTTRPAV